MNKIAKDLYTPGSSMSVRNKAKNLGYKTQRKISRNDLSFTKQTNNTTNYFNEATSIGWLYDNDQQTWTHEQYGDKKFTSLVHYIGEYKDLMPHANGEDPKGLAYECSTLNAGSQVKFRQNKWRNEEFDTRMGRRRGRAQRKKEMEDEYGEMPDIF
tara:strand:+ start:977 stop:1444 length:468 start_codon:yes stop_codon:yes gene_type:complete